MKKSNLERVTACLLSLLLLPGCSRTTPPSLENTDTEKTEGSQVYDMVYFAEINTLNYLQTDSDVDYGLCANLVDNLVDYDSYGNIVPGLAESWSSNEDMTEWTFHIRKGVKWVDCEGKEVAEVKADDWVIAAQYVNDAENEAGNEYIYYTGSIVHNAEAYYNYTEYMYLSDNGRRATDDDGNILEPVAEVKPEDIGVKALDDYTLVYTLDQPCPFFLSCLSYTAYMPVNRAFLEERGDMFGRSKENILYNGAFRLTEYIPQEKRTLVKNETYWDKDNVHIDVINAKFSNDMNTVSPESFLNGELDQVLISTENMEKWMSDPQAASQVHSMRPDITYSYFYAFNFKPEFDSKYEPDNWALAVTNENFRKAITHALDRRSLAEVYEPYNPEILLQRTITPETFVSHGGKDYTSYGPLETIMAQDPFNVSLAQQYRDSARTELEAAGVTFPIKILLPYNPAVINWREECGVAKQQLEDALGTDFIEVIVERGPDTGFLSSVRRSGKYALLLCNYGADFADPATYAEPFVADNTYNFWDKSADPEIKKLFSQYSDLITQGMMTYDDIDKRYDYYAQAEALLIEHAIICPSRVSNGEGYVADRLSQFDGQFAPYGLARSRYKGMIIHENSMSMEEFNAAYAKWDTERLANDQ
ncbi:MAG: peptide ABC transporter substrate-binding protein [Lachnospiraceae bacterium]|nr:peptide ABC transporter substrate-binding protein [Lachnospiraceae bacterium]MBR6158002.1 peptide ABC transporter substrate-binding protein [Lachnospiraceae bacterium]